MKKIIVSDMDGVLIDEGKRRYNVLKMMGKEAYFDEDIHEYFTEDEIKEFYNLYFDISLCYLDMFLFGNIDKIISYRLDVVILTGRESDFDKCTEREIKFLKELGMNVIDYFDNPFPDMLDVKKYKYMVLQSLKENYDILFYVDDRKDIVDYVKPIVKSITVEQLKYKEDK